jgi:hypothetical protein
MPRNDPEVLSTANTHTFLSSKQYALLENALIIARERYRKDALELAGFEHLAEAFQDQIVQINNFLEILNEYDGEILIPLE